MPNESPILILHASTHPYISIARRYGGFTMNKQEYTYLPLQDAFLRNDYIKTHYQMRKEGKSWTDFIKYIQSLKQT